VYFFHGPEEWVKQSAAQRLREKLLPPGLEELNETVLEGGTAQRILEAAETLPVMADRRLVLVRDYPPLTPGKAKAEQEEAQASGVAGRRAGPASVESRAGSATCERSCRRR
jgi:DNA polymerase III delta subunit